MMKMFQVPYALAVKNLVCLIIYTRLGIAQAMRAVCKFMKNPSIEY